MTATSSPDPSTGRARDTPPRRYRTPLRGHAFAGAVPAEVLVDGSAVELVREPDNPADPLAVAAWLVADDGRSWRIGYLDRTVAARLAPRMDAGTPVTAHLDGWVPEPGGRWERPLIRLEVAQQAGSVQAGLWGRPPGVRRRRLPPGER